MLEQLFNLIQGNAQQEIINNPAIPNEHNNQAVGLATESIFSGLQGALANGGLQQVLSLFGGKSSAGLSNPIVSSITNNLVGSLMGKLGINNGIATNIASSLIPSVLSKLVGHTSDPSNKGFDINGIIGSLIGGGNSAAAPANNATGGFDFNNILNQLTGGQAVQAPTAPTASDNNGFDFGDILSKLTGGGAQAQQGQQGGGGFQDILNMVTQGAQGQQQQNQQQGGGGIMDLLKGVIGG
jgi:hypothetical protein